MQVEEVEAVQVEEMDDNDSDLIYFDLRKVTAPPRPKAPQRTCTKQRGSKPSAQSSAEAHTAARVLQMVGESAQPSPP